jgi:hypothetical protein
MSMMCFSGGMLRLIENSMDRFGNGIEVEEPLAAVLGGNERE